ncbi:MAG: hypothetical protein ACLSHC_08340 [Bilophila wadsworthia]
MRILVAEDNRQSGDHVRTARRNPRPAQMAGNGIEALALLERELSTSCSSISDAGHGRLRNHQDHAGTRLCPARRRAHGMPCN